MAPFTCGVINGSGQPIPGVQITFHQFQPDEPNKRFLATTGIDGYVTSWLKKDGKAERGLTFVDEKPLRGFLSICVVNAPSRSPGRRICINIDLLGGKHHCVLLRLHSQTEYTVQQDSFLPSRDPDLHTYNPFRWSEEEDRKLLALRSEGLASKQINEQGLIPGRTPHALTSRYKVLVRRLRGQLSTCAKQQRGLLGTREMQQRRAMR